MTLPDLPAPGSTAWYAHYAALDANARAAAVGGSGTSSTVYGPPGIDASPLQDGTLIVEIPGA